MERVKKEHWEQWLEELEGEEIWTANKYVDSPPSDGGKARIPTLRRREANGNIMDVNENAAKSRYLFDSFFSQDQCTQSSANNPRYPDPPFQLRPITDTQIY